MYKGVGMDKAEVLKLQFYLNKDMIMLEWGSGGSTLYFPRFVKMYHSIEHSKGWYHRILDNITENTRLYYVPQNLPRTRPTKRDEFKDYVEYIHCIGVPKYDAVFIDGRARVACAMEAIKYMEGTSVMFLHDSQRAEYAPIFDKYDVIDKAGSLRVFKLKNEQKNTLE